MDRAAPFSPSGPMRAAIAKKDRAEIIRLARRERGWTQEELGQRCGLGGPVISRLETGAQGLSDIRVLQKLAEALEIPPHLLGVTPDPDQAATGQPSVPRPRAAPAAVRVPAQLPADLPEFAGRCRELDHLDMLLGQRRKPPAAVVITAVSGTAGVGKTSLAVHWAHQIRGRFPDGQLYVDLRGFHRNEQMDPADAIRGFLDAFHVSPDRIPIDLDAQAAYYRSLLDGKRVLVVLDNARDADHVRSLLPGAPGCLVIVTSRNPLASLISREGAKPITLDLFDDAEATQLLEHRIGNDRVCAEPQATQEIIRACARLPLALAMVATRAASHPRFALASLATELHDVRAPLDSISDEGPNSDLRAVFSWSYCQLNPEAARLFRFLGLHPGPEISAAAAASLAGFPSEQTRQLLDELIRARLVTEHAPSRYGFHDLLRAYAVELTHTNDFELDRHSAIQRMLDHYLRTAYNAERQLRPSRSTISLPPPQPGATPEHMENNKSALDWFTREHRVLLQVLDQAAASGLDGYVWPIAWCLDTYFDRQGHWHDRAMLCQLALDTTRRTGDRPAQACALRMLGRACIKLGRLDDARSHLQLALELCATFDDRTGQAHAHGSLAKAFEWQGSYTEALSHARQALDLFRTTGYRVGQARVLNDVGWFLAMLGEHQEALVSCEQALVLHQQLGNIEGEASAWDSLGYAHHHLGHHDDALGCYRRALDLLRELGERYTEATVLTHIGDTERAIGDYECARHSWQQAAEILDDLGHDDAKEVRAKLVRLPSTAE